VGTDASRWESREEERVDAGHRLLHHVVRTPAGEMTTDYMPDRGMSGWRVDTLVKAEDDLDRIAFLPRPDIDVAAVNARRDQLGDRGLAMLTVNGPSDSSSLLVAP